MFEELNNAFPGHTHFYEVVGLSLTEAMESAARLAAGDPHVLNMNGKIIFAAHHAIPTADIDWLIDVPGAPIDAVEEVIEEVVEEVVNETTTKSKKG